jgi:hypothetical protein
MEFFKQKTENENLLSKFATNKTIEKESHSSQMATMVEYLLREDDRKMKMIEEIYKKNVDLENRIHKLENREGRRIKKEITEYLKEIKRTVLYTDWLETITITYDEFEFLDNYDYKECMLKIIKRLLKSTDEIPLCAFTNIQKNNIYLYSKTGWVKLEFENIKSLIHRIDAEYNRWFFEWSSKNTREDETPNDKYYNYLVKIDCLNLLNAHKLGQIRKCMYDVIAK